MPGCVARRTEQLGRRIFSKKTADRAYRGRVLPKVFESDDFLISVDRLSTASLADVEQAARRTSVNRPPLQGWAVVNCGEVRDAGRRRVRASPQTENPYHADIVPLPTTTCTGRELRKQHAQELAKIAQWQPSSTWVAPSS